MPHTVHELSLESIMQLGDGSVAIAWHQALQRSLHDCCSDRPGVDKPRKVTLEMDVVPVIDEAGFSDEVNATFQVKESIPARKSRIYDFSVRQVKGKHAAVFSEVSADGSPTLFDTEENG